MSPLDRVLSYADDQLEASLGRLFDVLRFPSVGTDPAYRADCRACARWVEETLTGMGFTAELRETTGQPVVIARSAADGLPPAAPHVLFYGHYDVQPADPPDFWESPPFAPRLRKGQDGRQRIFARGASDDKGQLMTFLEAGRAWLEVEGRLPFRLTVLIEGDEEGDNSHLDRFLKDNVEAFPCDVALVCDTGLWDDGTPAVTTRLRGCMCEEVTITGPSRDLHSGYYGGAAINPIRVLTKILGELHDGRGRVAVPGFYDDVEKVSARERAAWRRLDSADKVFLHDVGLKFPAGERGYSALEQAWIRPTAELNGICGGYTGEGRKTVLPAKAVAKLTFRLVRRQDPKKIRRAFRKFVKDRLPKDCRVTFDGQGGESSGVAVSDKSPWLKIARAALAAEWGRPPVLMGSGGSIPVVATFQDVLKVESLLVGFALDTDAVHSPNEKYDLRSFHKGIRSWVRIIAGLAQQGAP